MIEMNRETNLNINYLYGVCVGVCVAWEWGRGCDRNRLIDLRTSSC